MPFKKYNNPDELKSKYVHEPREKHEALHVRLDEFNNDDAMKTQGLDQISKIWDSIIDTVMGRNRK